MKTAIAVALIVLTGVAVMVACFSCCKEILLWRKERVKPGDRGRHQRCDTGPCPCPLKIHTLWVFAGGMDQSEHKYADPGMGVDHSIKSISSRRAQMAAQSVSGRRIWGVSGQEIEGNIRLGGHKKARLPLKHPKHAPGLDPPLQSQSFSECCNRSCW